MNWTELVILGAIIAAFVSLVLVTAPTFPPRPHERHTKPPWLCRAFGHAYIQKPVVRVNDRNWYQPGETPLTPPFCRRCGHRPLDAEQLPDNTP
jgi:hypothetical protein